MADRVVGLRCEKCGTWPCRCSVKSGMAERIAALEAEREKLQHTLSHEIENRKLYAAWLVEVGKSLGLSNKPGYSHVSTLLAAENIIADLHAAMRALEQAHGGGQCKCCRFTFDGREGRCFANETLTRLRAAYPEVLNG